jgi:hypothetical protein
MGPLVSSTCVFPSRALWGGNPGSFLVRNDEALKAHSRYRVKLSMGIGMCWSVGLCWSGGAERALRKGFALAAIRFPLLVLDKRCSGSGRVRGCRVRQFLKAVERAVARVFGVFGISDRVRRYSGQSLRLTPLSIKISQQLTPT